jgi:hypothetical protein
MDPLLSVNQHWLSSDSGKRCQSSSPSRREHVEVAMQRENASEFHFSIYESKIGQTEHVLLFMSIFTLPILLYLEMPWVGIGG